MNTKIHPYLIARLIAVQEAFNNPGVRPALAVTNAMQAPPAKKGNNWKDILNEEEDEQGGGGRGTMKGNRGKNAVNAANALRKLSRNR